MHLVIKKVMVSLAVLLLASLWNITTLTNAEGNVKIGEYIEFGQYEGQPIYWQVVHIDRSGNPLLLANRVLSLKAFDVGGEHQLRQRKFVGGNRWATSTLRTWLNSEDTRVSWNGGTPSKEWVDPSNRAYEQEAGFLSSSNFTKKELDMISPMTQSIMLSSLDTIYRESGTEAPSYNDLDTGLIELENSKNVMVERVTSKVSLLTLDELNRYVISPKRNLVVSSDRTFASDVYWNDYSRPYFILAPDASGKSIYGVDKYGTMSPHHPRDSFGVRPALYLNGQASQFSSGNGTLNYPYSFKKTQLSIKQKLLELSIGAGQTLQYDILPKGSKDEVTWSIKNPTIASVAFDGTVLAKKEGRTTVTATLQASGESVTVPVNVTKVTSQPTVGKTVIGKHQIPSTISNGSRHRAPFSDIAGGSSLLVGHDKAVRVVYETKSSIVISVLDERYNVKKVITLKKSLPLFGDIEIDEIGNYYVLYGKPLKEADRKSSSVEVHKFNPSGKLLSIAKWNGYKTDVLIPFDGGNAELTYNQGLLSIYFARLMYKAPDNLNHQSTVALYLNVKSMKPFEGREVYASHSFNQQVLPLENQSFLFVDQGDASPRGFQLTKVTKESSVKVTPFHFREGFDVPFGYNYTFAQLGGIAVSNKTYALVGTSEKTLSRAPALYPDRNESRNIFIQVFNQDWSNVKSADQLQDLVVSRGATRTVKGSSKSGMGSYFLQPDIKNHGVKWLSNYSGKIDVAQPKIVTISNHRFVVLWEVYNRQKLVDVNYQILSSHGEPLSLVRTLKNTRLPFAETPIYHGGKILWNVVIPKPGYDDGKLELHHLSVKN